MKNKHLGTLFVMLMLACFPVMAVSLGGMFKTELAYSHLNHGWQKQMSEIDLELNGRLGPGDVTLLTRASLDRQDWLTASRTPSTYARGRSLRHDARHGSAELREFYWEAESGQTYWRLGKQQVVWGEADGLKLLDVINPQSYREFVLDDFDDSRIPLWMVNAEHILADDSILQFLWIVDNTTHELAGAHSPFRFTSPLLVPQANPSASGSSPGVEVNAARAPARATDNNDFALRLARFWNGWDVTLNYLYHMVDEPVLRTRREDGRLLVDAEYQRSHLVGGSASTALGDFIVRLELAYETDRYHRSEDALPGVVKANQWGSVLGLDFQGWSDQLLSVQWFQSRILGQKERLMKDQTEHVMTLIWEHRFINDTLTLRASNLHSLNRDDGLLRAKLTYNVWSNLDVYLGSDRFYGNRDGVFGQFDQADRIVFGVEVGF